MPEHLQSRLSDRRAGGDATHRDIAHGQQRRSPVEDSRLMLRAFALIRIAHALVSFAFRSSKSDSYSFTTSKSGSMSRSALRVGAPS